MKFFLPHVVGTSIVFCNFLFFIFSVIIIIIIIMVISIIIIIVIIIIIIIDGSHYVWQKAQTAILHYTRGATDWPALKPDTGMLTHLLLEDSGTRLQRHSLARTSIFRNNTTSLQLGLSRQTPLINANHKRHS